MNRVLKVANITDLNSIEIGVVSGGHPIAQLIVAGARAAAASSTGKKIAAAAFAAAVAVASTVSGDDSKDEK